MNYNIEDIKNFVRTFELDSEGFFTENEVYPFINSIDRSIVPNFCWETGATKLVIIPIDTDYVIKIPFNANVDYFEFTGTLYSKDNKDNYCEEEIEIYNLAKTHHYQDFFLPIEHVYSTELDNYPIYIQEKAISFIDTNEADRENSYDMIKQIEIKNIRSAPRFNQEAGLIYSLPVDWLASCLTILNDINKLINFLMFLIDYDITDLHRMNIGYIDNMPIIIDYGGFNE